MQIKWFFDLPWHMVRLRDWIYMRNCATWSDTIYNHFRILGIRRRVAIGI